MKNTDLKPEYKKKEFLWNLIVKRILMIVVWLWDSETALVSYPLRVEIELGSMKYYYFVNGFRAAFKRAWTFNWVLSARFKGIEEKDYYAECLTEKAKFNYELDKEMSALNLE